MLNLTLSKNFQKTDGKLRKIFETYTKKVVSLTYKDPLDLKIKKTKFTGEAMQMLVSMG